MAFQFMCPQGHLLEGDEALAGTQLKCPHCQILFVVPDPIPAAAAAEPHPLDVRRPRKGDFNPSPYHTPPPDLVHIPCPKGHVVEVPPELFGQEIACPTCGASFTLKGTDSLEYKKKRASDIEAADRKSANHWMQWAVIFAVLVIGSLIFFILSGV